MLCGGMTSSRSNVVNHSNIEDLRIESPVDVVECMEVDIIDMKKDLHAAMAGLATQSRDDLFVTLREILQLSHLYYLDWQHLQVDSALVHTVVDIIRRYESNGLQLHGDAIRLLLKLATSHVHSKVILSTLSDQSVIELLLRLTLEHPVYEICLAVLGVIVAADDFVFSKICDMGT